MLNSLWNGRTRWVWPLLATVALFLVGLSYCRAHLNWADVVTDAHGYQHTVLTDQGDRALVHPQGKPEAASSWIHHDQITERRPGTLSLFRRLDPTWLAIGYAIWAATLVGLATRWTALLNGLLGPTRFRDALLWHLRASVAELIGLGTVGTDGTRIAYAGRSLNNFPGVATVQVMERCLGLGALIIMILFGTWLVAESATPTVQTVAVWAAFVLPLLLAIGLTGAIVLRRHAAENRRPRGQLGSAFVRVRHAVAALASRPSLAAQTIGWSLGIQLSTVLYHYALASALGLSIDLRILLAVVPIVSFVIMIPISIAGLGVFESAMILLLTTLAGVSTTEAITLCLLHRVLWLSQRLIALPAFWVTTGAHARLPSSTGESQRLRASSLQM